MDDTTGLFTPHEGPYGVGFLDQISNGAASWLFYGSGNYETAGSILGTIYGTLNLAILIFAAIVGTLAFFEGSAESAATGQVGGRNVSPFRTMGRIAIGGVALFPISGGMSLLQLAVVALASWGIGLADYAWSKTADAIVSAGDYTTSAAPGVGQPDRETVLKFATVLRAMTSMEVCAKDFDDIAAALALQAPSLSLERVDGSTSGWTTRLWMYRDTSIPRPPPYLNGNEGTGPDIDAANRANYNYSAALCGSVKIFVKSGVGPDQLSLGDQGFASTALDMAGKVDALAVNVTMKAGIEAVESTLRPQALTIAGIIRGTVAGTDADIERIAARAPVQAAKVFLGQVGGGLTRQMGEFQLGNSLQEAARSDGWMFAASWQRMGANISRAVAGLRAAMGIEVPRTPSSARQYFGASAIDQSSTLAGLVRANDDHQARLATLNAVWTPPDDDTGGAGTSGTGLTQPGEAKATLGRAWAELTGSMAGDRAADPMLQYERLGQSMFNVLGVLASAETLSSLGAGLPFVGGAVSTVDSFLERMIEIVGVAGIALMVVLPVIPILYFVGAIVGWLGLVIECMFSMPVLLVTFFSAARGGTWLDTALPGAKTLFGLLLRPFLIIAGLVVMMAATRVVAPFVDLVFSTMFVLANPNGGFFGVVFFGVLAVFYCIACFAVVLTACRFIAGLGDGVMGLIGGYVSSLGRDHLSDHMVMPVNPASTLGRGATSLPANPGSMGRAGGRESREAIGRLLRRPVASGGSTTGNQ